MKPIETIYKGYRFRSRLEARWAVFFDALGVKYEYEKEGYDLNGIRYLPDFWLPKLNSWFEVKGQFPPSSEEYEKCRLLCVHSQKWVYMAVGEIQIPAECDMQEALDGRWTQLYSYDPSSSLPDHIYPDCPLNAWCECPECHKIEITQEGRTCFLSCRCHQETVRFFREQGKPHEAGVRAKMGDELYEEMEAKWQKHLEWKRSFDTPRIIAAYTAARQARFEYGERG